MEIVHRISGGMLSKIIFIARCPAFPESRWGKKSHGDALGGENAQFACQRKKNVYNGIWKQEMISASGFPEAIMEKRNDQ